MRLTAPAGNALADAARYDQQRVRSIHNAYAKEQSIFDQLTHYAVRSLELDLVPTKCDRSVWGDSCPSECTGVDCGARDDDWFVYHAQVILPDEHRTSCLRLSDCLGELSAFHRQDPAHSVVTVFLDLKREALLEDGTRTGDDLDGRLERHIPRGSIFTPADLVDRCFAPDKGGSLAEAARTCGWPRLSELTGKFIFVLTGESGMARYTADGTKARDRRAFVASRGLAARTPWTVFANLTDRDLGAAPKDAPHDGLVRRVYAVGRCIPLLEMCTWAGGFDDVEIPNADIQHLAIDRVGPSGAPVLGPLGLADL